MYVTLDLAILVLVAEVLEEFDEYLVFCLFTALNFRMELCVEYALEIGGFDGSTAVLVELQESFVNNCLSPFIRFALIALKEMSVIHGFQSRTRRN